MERNYTIVCLHICYKLKINLRDSYDTKFKGACAVSCFINTKIFAFYPQEHESKEQYGRLVVPRDEV